MLKKWINIQKHAIQSIENVKIRLWQKHWTLWMEPILVCNDSYNHPEIAYGLASKQFKMLVYKSVEWAFTKACLRSCVTQMTLMPQRWRTLMSVSDYNIQPLDSLLFSTSMQHSQTHLIVSSLHL